MQGNIGFRVFVILLVVGFLGVLAYRGVSRTAAGDENGLQLGIDLRGGSEIYGKFDFSDTDPGVRTRLLTEALGIIQERIDGYGLKDIVIQPIGDDRFSVQISAKEKENVEAIKELISVLGHLEFRITVEPTDPNYEAYWRRFREALDGGVEFEQARSIPPEDRVRNDIENGRYPLGLRWYRLSDQGKGNYRGQADRLPPDAAPFVLCRLDNYNITGESLQNVTHRQSQEGLGGEWVVVFGIAKFHQDNMTALTQTKGEHMAIILNDHVDSAPVLRSTLTDSGQISGSFTEDHARSLSAVLQAGALRQKPELTAERTVASDLAGDARDQGVLSVVLGFVAVLFIMVWLYLGPGLLANVALLLNLVLVVGVLYWFGAVLTLPGLAGLVLTVGMAVDANILVFERIKEEKAKGRTVAQAVATGYDRALVTIIDSNLTTLITAYFLFQIGSGPVRGFGIVLAIGIISSMFTALYVTRTLFAILMQRGAVTEVRMRGAFAPPSIGWMGMKRIAVPASALAMVAGLVLYVVVPETKKYDLDFTQGAKLILRLNRPLTVDEVQTRLATLGEKDPQYRDVSLRVSAEGIGAAVGATEGTGFELRTQRIGRQADIDRFVGELRAAFAAELLPGPFEATVEEAPGGHSTGLIYFVSDLVTEDLLDLAFQQFNAARGDRLPGAKVDRLDPVAGAASVFRLDFAEPATNAGGLALNVRRALAEFDLAEGIRWLEARTGDESLTMREQEQATTALARIRELPDPLPAELFQECDPFPLADRIDPSTAREHRDAAVRAVALSILGIIAYVAFRFRAWSYGFAAVVALIHDVLVTMGVIALVNWLGLFDARLNLVTVAAFLTLIGYSINDTIVVFDRIRENRGTGRSRLSEIIDKSLNQTLGRTLRTSATTWIVVFILLVMNMGANSALEGFAFILAFGILVGTYSSIFVASPTLLFLPWLWERSGSSLRTLLRRSVPWMAVAAIVLVGIDWVEGRFLETDPPTLVMEDILLALPIGLMAFFLLHFVRFVRADPVVPATTTA